MQQLDIAYIIEQKAGRRLPGVVASLLGRIIHQDEINEILRLYSDREGVDFLVCLHQHLGVSVEWLGAERLPESGRAIFACNHPLGAIDGTGISQLLGERYGSVRYLVNDLLYHLEPLKGIFLPVNTYGAQRKEQASLIQQAMQSDLPIGTFPAGYCSRRFNKEVEDREWQRSFVSLAIQYDRPIVPLHFMGQNSELFYRLDRLRRWTGMKFDFTTAMLPREMFRQRGKSFRVLVGEPIAPQELHRLGASPKEIAARIRALSYDLPRQYAQVGHKL